MKHTVTIPTGRILGVLIIWLAGTLISGGLRYALALPEPSIWLNSVEFMTGWFSSAAWLEFGQEEQAR